jgi:hypothetical protein
MQLQASNADRARALLSLLKTCSTLTLLLWRVSPTHDLIAAMCKCFVLGSCTDSTRGNLAGGG